MTKLTLSLYDIRQIGLLKSADMIRELLDEFEKALGPYEYDANSNSIEWNVNDDLFADFTEALGQDLYFRLHILFPRMQVE